MDKPGEQHCRALHQLIGYVGSTYAKLYLQKPSDLKVFGFVDSNFATNKDTRQSVTGYILTVGGSLILWMSKMQPSVTLSLCEAEYVALCTCATEVKFIQMLFEELLPKHNTRPKTLLEDNTGTIHLVENATIGNRTKHIDVRYYHIQEMYKEGRLQVKFVRSENNYADLMTKNVTEKFTKSWHQVLNKEK